MTEPQPTAVPSAGPRVGFVMEQTLGHITHYDNLRRLVGDEPGIRAEFEPIPFDIDGWRARVPAAGNWTVRAGVRARRAIARLRSGGSLDALFVHTQVPAVGIPDLVRRIPTVVSLDATPLQYDELGVHYAHDTSSEKVERLKWRANKVCFDAAAAVVAWAEWTRQGLIDDYGTDPGKITVIPPGVDIARWTAIGAGRREPDHAATTTVLFVGGDFARKGGPSLVRAVGALRADGIDIDLDVVTRDDVEAGDGVRVHHGLTPNSPALIELYHRADVFCLPTLGDCLPMVLSEAGAVGLPLVSTAVGAIHEIVRDGVTGLLVPVADDDALSAALRRLAGDAALRERLGSGARDVVTATYDAATNAGRLVALLERVASRPDRPFDQPVLLTVSGTIPADIGAAVAEGRRPRADYLAMSDGLDARLIDRTAFGRSSGRLRRVVERIVGGDVSLAMACVRRRKHHRVVFTDGEQVGIPYAAMTLPLRRRPRHVMIGHRLTPSKKALLHRLLRIHRRVDAVVVYSSTQRRFAIEHLGYQPEQVVLSPFMVDTAFWDPEHTPPSTTRTRPLIGAVGQELRDYPTLAAAVDGIDADVVIAAASPWSKRADTSAGLAIPDNVSVDAYDLYRLRQLYADASLVVVPLQETDFQAGVTSILEAMSMGRAVIVSRTAGQVDLITDGVNGRYVDVGDVTGLRVLIEELLADEAQRLRLGEAARRWVVEHADLGVYVADLARTVAEVQRST